MLRILTPFILTTLILLSAAGSPVQAQTNATTLNLELINRATVYIMQTQETVNGPIITCVSSGTIVDRTGLIATNAHSTVPNTNCPGENLIIALSVRPGEPPVPSYRARVDQANIGLDLALLRITQELNGRTITPGSVFFPFVELGDSNQVNLDQTVTIVGYPGIGDDPIADYRGTINAFVAEPSGGERSWFKTEAAIPGTMTGGGVYDQNGRLIAIPTTAPGAAQGDDTRCVVIEDTNNDGLVNANDACVPIGGFINALRPSNFVRPLLRSASLGIQVQNVTASQIPPAPAGEPSFSRLLISSSVSEGMPTNVARSLPTGTTSLYLFFDYANMTPETIYEMRVTIDNVPSAAFSLAPVRWSGGENGIWYIGNRGQTWPNGRYEFTLFINGAASGSITVLVGAAQTTPTFSNIQFGMEGGDNIFSIGRVLPTGNVASARFIHRNMENGMNWSRIWYYNGAEIRRVEEEWTNNGQDTRTTRIQDDNGLPPGQYRLELYIEDRLAATSDFIIAGASVGAFPRVFQNMRSTSATDQQQALTATSTSSFSGGVRSVFALFDWERLARGTLWKMRWTVDDTIFYEQTSPWNTNETGENFLVQLTGNDGIPDGTYRMELLINDVSLAELEMEVGIGQLPIDSFASATGVQLNGQIIDAETGAGIPGVSFILLNTTFSAEFAWRRDQIYAMATTDRNGRFQLDRLLEFDNPYSVMVSARGYLPVTGDVIRVTGESENPLDIVIPLTRD